MVEILEGTDKYPLRKIGKMAGICWNSPINDVEKNIKRAKDCINSGHGRVLEYVDVESCISDVSARVIREWYTAIGGSPTRLQESTRYVDCKDFEFYTPNIIKNDPIKMAVYNDCMTSIKINYIKLLNLGTPKEDCANMLPLGMMTKIVDKRNLRNIMTMCEKRLCNRAYHEYRNLMNEYVSKLSEISDEWKWICDNVLICQCDRLGYCTENKSCGKMKKKEER